MLTPANNSQADDFFSAKDCDIMYNTYAYSSGGTQSDSINFYNSWLERCWCCQTTTTHGQQAGHWANMFGGGMQDAWKLFEGNSQGPATIEGVWCEAFIWLGNFGLQNGGAVAPINFIGCRFSWGNAGANPNYEPYQFTAAGPINFDSCDFNGETYPTVFNYFNSGSPCAGSTTFKNCNLWNFASGPTFIGINDYAGGAALLGNQAINSNVYIGSSTPSTCINNQFLGMAGFSRQPIAPWVSDVKLMGNNGFSNYHVNVCPQVYMTPAVDFGGGTITGTGHNAVLTFTVNFGGEVLVNDLVICSVPDRTGTLTNNGIPAFKVTAVNSGTGAVTAQGLYDTITATSIPHIYLALPLFINGASSTCTTNGTTTNGTTTLTNVTNISNFAVGDWIQGTRSDGSANRILSISGTSMGMSRNVNVASANNVPIYNCGLTAY
jgi:hypothetical protein